MNKKVIPAILAIVLIAGSTLSIYFNKMTLFMGIFFILFSFAKLLDLKGFQEAFSKYDPLARISKAYGFIYPFIELALGVLFLFNLYIQVASIITIFIMGVGTIGVSYALFGKKKLQCACLGTRIGIPLTQVTLFENVLMVVMAIMLLI